MDPIYTEYHVHGLSANFIRKLWILNNPVSHPPVFNKGVPPNGCFTIAVIQGNGLNISHKGQITRLSEGIYFCGQITEALSIDLFPGTKATMIQLFPWTPSCFGISNAWLFTDKICFFSEVTDLKVLDVETMKELENQALCRYLTKAFSHSFRNNISTDLIAQSTKLILAHKGNLTVSSIAWSLECSERHLQKLFKNFIGISPKLFINIIKLREALDDVAYPDHKPVTMAQLAVSNGYYDQPHFNSNFSSFIRTTPKNFRKEDFFLTIKKE